MHIPFRIRPVDTLRDEQQWLEIHNSATSSRQWIRSDLAELRARSLSYRQLLAEIGNKGSGAALAVILRTDAQTEPVNAWVSVAAEVRLQGIGATLFRSLSRWAHTNRKVAFRTWVEEADEQSIDFARRRGFDITQREQLLVLNRQNLPVAAASPPAMLIRPYVGLASLAAHPVIASQVHTIAADTFPLQVGSAERGYQTWIEREMERAQDCDDIWFISFSSGNVTGFSRLRVRNGSHTGSHSGTAVQPAWRSQGVAHAMKVAQMEWAFSNGVERLEATYEPNNPAKTALYRSLGYEVVSGRVLMTGPAWRPADGKLATETSRARVEI